ncbi:alpha/beta hydrolase [Roseovarius autotrophicus]|uniref:alpha/beta hydrolase n=1 Tax=Roseovarius autotrophicus TaxID=2824121 RepID=UPI0019FDD3CD|nr:alpha/beta hydrolase [Roseovarius autotrophicus]MBE0454181.1 alpha/beta hydrolase [Roseovarius sp.]
MPLVHVNTGDHLPTWALDAGSGPVIIMVHGFRYAPGHASECPHRQIFSLAPERECFKVVSWPRGLGFDGTRGDEGLALGFGWNARGTLWQAYREAVHAGEALAATINVLQARAPHRPVHAIAHSLGARVVLSALSHLKPGAIDRAILLAGAEFGHHAAQALASPAGHAAEIINVTTRENDVYDFLLECLIPAPARGDRSLGLALPTGANVLTLQLDDPGTLDVLNRAGYDVAPPATRICHWSAYTRPGALDFYAALLRDPDRLSIAQLRAALPERAAPRWSRLLPEMRLHLPMGRKASF